MERKLLNEFDKPLRNVGQNEKATSHKQKFEKLKVIHNNLIDKYEQQLRRNGELKSDYLKECLENEEMKSHY